MLTDGKQFGVSGKYHSGKADHDIAFEYFDMLTVVDN